MKEDDCYDFAKYIKWSRLDEEKNRMKIRYVTS